MSKLLPTAIVLAAGFGQRLAPLTLQRAKPAVPVAGTPLILRLLTWLKREGVRSVVINLHHRPETITSVVGHGDRMGLTIRYSWEPTLLGSAGGPRRALPLLGSRFLIVNGDSLVDFPLEELHSAHEANGALVTLAVQQNHSPAQYGGAIVDRLGRISRFSGAGHPTARHFVGVQLAESSAFRHLRTDHYAATIGSLYEELISQRVDAIQAYEVATPFYDVGTPDVYLKTSLKVAAEEGRIELPIGKGSIVHPTASLTRTAVWDDVTVGEQCQLRDCIIGDGVKIPPGTQLDGQIISVSQEQGSTIDNQNLASLMVTPITKVLSKTTLRGTT